MQPIASHVEKNLERTGVFTLYSDRIDALIRHPLSSSLTVSVPLAELSTSVGWLEVRSSLFNAGLWAFVIAAVGLGISTAFALSQSAQALLWATALFGVVLCLAGWRKALFAVLAGSAGGNRVLVGVGPTGREGLRRFAAQIEEALRTDHAARA